MSVDYSNVCAVCLQVQETEEVAVLPNTTAEGFAADMFEYIEGYPPAPLADRLTDAQLAALQREFLPRAAARAERWAQGTSLVRPYFMLWAVAKAWLLT